MLKHIDELEIIEVKYDPNYITFGLIGEPHVHKQHSNQQRGLNEYVDVINFDTGQKCHKKLYLNTKGKYFKHTGYSPMYIKDFVNVANVIPFQIIV